MSTILAIVSDTHAGSTVGLCPPRVTLDDDGEYRPSHEQRRTWGWWSEYWREVATRAAGNEVVAVFLGDMIEGDSKARSTQVITRNKADLLRLAAATLEPALDIAARCYFVRGTGAHVGKSASLEESLAADCETAVHTPGGSASWWVLSGMVDGVNILAQHHGPGLGRDPWTKYNALMKHAFKLSLARPSIALSLCAHNHRHADTGDAYPTRHIALPCWQGQTEYSHRLGMIEPPDIGGVIVACDKGRYTVDTLRYTAPRQAAKEL